MNQKWKSYLFWIGLSAGIGVLAAIVTRQGIAEYGMYAQQPALAPPGALFPIVWTVLYVLMGIGAARISLSTRAPGREKALNVFVAQLIVNFFWSLIFFNAKAYGLAFVWILLLWALILWMILLFRKFDRVAAYLQIPYLLWVSFAAYLSWQVWKLNG